MRISQRALLLPLMRSRADWIVAAVWCLIIVAGTCRADDAAAVADTDRVEQAPAELSVAPLAYPIYPDDRPDWIDQDPYMDGIVHQWPVASVPSLNRERSHENLREQIRAAISAYVNMFYERDRGGLMRAPLVIKDSWVEVSLDAAEKRYFGTVETSDGEMHEEAVLLRFDQSFQGELHREWRNQQVGLRLKSLGLLGGSSLVLLIGLSIGLRRASSRRG